jgi:hypothetical protein
LTTVSPNLAAEWHPSKNGSLMPQDVGSGSTRKVWWLGSCKHEWEARIWDRYDGTSCPYCAGSKVLAGFNDFATVHPTLAAEWHPTKNIGLSPTLMTSGSGKKVWWLGVCGHEWEAQVRKRVEGRGCPFCSSRTVLIGFNDLAFSHPSLTQEWHPTRNGNLMPYMVTTFSSKKVWWLGSCGHEWEQTVSSRTARFNKCPFCCNQKILAGFNDLATTHPKLVSEWHPTKNKTTPYTVTYGSNRSLTWWQCSLGHEWKTSVSNRTSKEPTGCPFCCNQKILKGFNDLATTHPLIAAEWHSVKNSKNPNEVGGGSSKKFWWQCEKGHEWKTEVRGRVAGKSCIFCGFGVSREELVVINFVKSLLEGKGVEVFTSVRNIISPLELDIYIPELKVAIEFNGIYWHSEAQGKNREYHYNKYLRCKEQGIQLIQIWEDDWRDKKVLVERLLSERLESNVYVSRNAFSVKGVSQKCAAQFFEKNLLNNLSFWKQSRDSIYLALLIEQGDIEKIIAIMEVTPVNNSNGTMAVQRFTSTSSTELCFSILINHIVTTFSQTKKLITISDNMFPNNFLYENNGFIPTEELPPDYMYVSGDRRRAKFEFNDFRKNWGFMYEDGLDLTALENLNNFNRIWDAGQTIWQLKTL